MFMVGISKSQPPSLRPRNLREGESFREGWSPFFTAFFLLGFSLFTYNPSFFQLQGIPPPPKERPLEIDLCFFTYKTYMPN